jgi:sec-independent protein translocase protein TatC
VSAAIGTLGHEDRLELVGHLDELRTRIIVSLAALAVAFGLCAWQNHALLRFINAPLAHQTQHQVREGHGPLGANYALQQKTRALAVDVQSLLATLDTTRRANGTRTIPPRLHSQVRRDIAQLSAAPHGDKPVTLGIGEPFTSTIGVVFIFALILSLPVILFQLYGFVIPAFGPEHRRIATPLALAVPGLFVAGASFGYFVVLPAAVHFFQNFNSDQYNVLVQAGPYYHFAAMTLLAMGLLFQVPVAILAATRAKIVTPAQLRRHRRYAVLACGAVAALLPGDFTTMILETVPLYLLFEASVLLAGTFERLDRRRAARAA